MRKKMFDFEPLVNMKFHERLQCVLYTLVKNYQELRLAIPATWAALIGQKPS